MTSNVYVMLLQITVTLVYSIGPRKYDNVEDVRDRLKVLYKQNEERPSTIEKGSGLCRA